MAIIEFKNITFRYESDEEGVVLAPAVKNLSLSINEGEFVAILGHNGSGKSTLAKLANGLLLPEEGTVLVDGMDTKNEEDDIKIKQTVGVVFQNPDNHLKSADELTMLLKLWVCMNTENTAHTSFQVVRSKELQLQVLLQWSLVASFLTSQLQCLTLSAEEML